MSSARSRRLASVFVASLLLAGVLSVSISLADELRLGTTTLISRNQAGQMADGGNPSISSDGRYVAFESWDRLTSEDTDVNSDIYRWDRLTGQTLFVSSDVPGKAANTCNFEPSISSDGQRIAYRAGGGEAGPAGRLCYTGYAAYRDMASNVTSYISGSGITRALDMSKDGRFVVLLYDFAGDYYARVVQLSNGGIPWESQILCEACVLPAPGEHSVAISGSGRMVAFEVCCSDIMVHDRDTDGDGVFDEPGAASTFTGALLPNGRTPSYSSNPALSEDGSTLTFTSLTALSPSTDSYVGGRLSVFARNLFTNTSELISQSSIGTPGAGEVSVSYSSPSRDGRYVAFTTQNPHWPPGDTNPGMDIYVRDRQEHKTHLVSVMPDGHQSYGLDGTFPSISADGTFVAFGVELASIQNDNNLSRSAYLRELWTPCNLSCLPNPSFVPPPPPTPPPPPPSPVPGCIASGTNRTCTYTASSSTTLWKGAANWWCVTVYQAQTSSIRTERCYSYFDGVYQGSIASVSGDKVRVSVFDLSGVTLGAVHAQDG